MKHISVAERDDSRPPHGLRFLHETPGERAEAEERLPRGLGLGRPPDLVLPLPHLPPGAGQLLPASRIRVHGKRASRPYSSLDKMVSQ